MYRHNLITIDLSAIQNNYRIMTEHLPKDVRVMAVVKANAYGHGMLEVAKAVMDIGCRDLAIAIPEEGIELRRHANREVNILVLGAVNEQSIEPCIRAGLTMTVFEPHRVAELEAAAARLHETALMHIKLDTGMSRIGLRTREEALALREALQKAPHVKVTGIYTHFAEADHLLEDCVPSDYTKNQLRLFQELRSCFDPGIPVHASNSAMSLVSSEANFSMIREGISLYGYPPVPTSLPFRPALHWESEVVYVKDIPQGTSIGYGCTFTADRPMRIATVAVGYGDGYHRMVSNRGQVLIGGKRARIVGRVCMDQIMVDVTQNPETKPGDIAVLIGRQGDDLISADELGAWAGTISYEVLLSITNRVPKTYLPAGVLRD